jgi:hypothetical protein
MDPRSVDIGIVSDPGLAEDVGAAVAVRLSGVLQQRIAGEIDWRVHHRTHPLATGEQTQLADIAAVDVPIDPAWDITVLLTDLPRGTARTQLNWRPALVTESRWCPCPRWVLCD